MTRSNIFYNFSLREISTTEPSTQGLCTSTMKCLSREQLQSLDVNTTSRKECKLIENAAITCMKELERTDAINADISRLIRSYPTTPLKKLEHMLYGPDKPMKFTLFGGYGFCRNQGFLGDSPWMRSYTKVHYIGSEQDSAGHIDGDAIAVLNDDVMTEGQYYVSIRMEGCNQNWTGVSCGVSRQFNSNRWNKYFREESRMVEPFILDSDQSRIDMDSLAHHVRQDEDKSCVFYKFDERCVTVKTVYYGTFGDVASSSFEKRLPNNSTKIEEVGLYVNLDNGTIDLHINGMKQYRGLGPNHIGFINPAEQDKLCPPLVFFVQVNDKAPVQSNRLTFQASCFR